MNDALDAAKPQTGESSPPDLRFLRVMLALQIILGLLWGISMLFFAKQIVLGEEAGPHIEKIAMEGAAHMTLVLAAILVWRAPERSHDVLLLMVFLNGLWTLTDLVYIPLLDLDELDFYVKVVVNAVLAVGLAVAGWRAGILFTGRSSAAMRNPAEA